MKPIMRSLVVPILVLVASLVLANPSAWAARVTKVKGKKVLINLEGEPAKKGQIFYVVDEKGRKKGVVKIRSIKGDKAIGKLGKGKAKKGYALLERTGKGGGKKAGGDKAAEAPKDSGTTMSSSQMGWGLLLGMGMDSMEVDLDITPAEKASLSGSGMSYKALFDYALFEKIWFRGTLGIENFEAEGDKKSSACDNKTCAVSIQYLSLDFWGRYLFSLGTFRPWLGAGFTLWFPMSQETTALEEDSITNTSVMGIGGGFDWFMNPSFYIPFQVEYGLLPASEQVSATVISIRFGLGMNF
ncbi:MAG: hypothetical protein KDD43_04465 [Bdellovibrionales bacterium]|nr:hypothetical protein [Bdellovibrionales bacterium]